MNSITLFLFFIPVLASVLLGVNLIFAPHNPYQEKSSTFECGFHSFLGQNRTQFSISFFVFALLFLVFDLELVMILPGFIAIYIISHYGISIMMIFLTILAIGFVFEIGKSALKIDSRQYSGHTAMSSNASVIIWAVNLLLTKTALLIVDIIESTMSILTKLKNYLSILSYKVFVRASLLIDPICEVLFTLFTCAIIIVPVVLGLTLSVSFENFVTLVVTLSFIIVYTIWRLPWQSMYFINKYICSPWYIIYMLAIYAVIVALSDVQDISVLKELMLTFMSIAGDEDFLLMNFKDTSNSDNHTSSGGDPNKGGPGGDPRKPLLAIAIWIPQWNGTEYVWYRDLHLEQQMERAENHGLTVRSAWDQELEDINTRVENMRRGREAAASKRLASKAAKEAAAAAIEKYGGPNFWDREGPGGNAGGGAGGGAGGTAGPTAVH